MAELTGKGGSITFAGITASVYSWSITYNCELHDKTDFADGATSIRTRMAGLKDWSATIEARLDTTNTADPGDTGTLTLTVVSGSTYSGTAFIESMAVNEPVDGPVTCTYTFQGSGALTPPS